MAETIGDVIAHYQLQDKLGYFVTDNASSNETCLDYLATEFGFNTKESWIRCSGHVLNLVAQAILFGSDEEAFEREVDNVDLEELQLTVWRRKGPLGKLHNVVYWIARSPQRNERLLALQRQLIPSDKPLELVKDVATRWNSFDAAAERAIQLRPAIDELMIEIEIEHAEYEARCRRSGKQPTRKPPPILNDRLSSNDWLTLAQYHEILAPLKKWTLDLQGHVGNRHGAIWRVIECYEELLAHFEALRQEHPVVAPELRRDKSLQNQQFDPTITAVSDYLSEPLDALAAHEVHFSTNINLGWQKLNDYFSKLDDTPVYVAAVVLHPRMKWRWLEKRWEKREDWIIAAKASFTKMSLRYKDRVAVGSEAATPPRPRAPTPPPLAKKARFDEADVLSDDDEDELAARATSIEAQLSNYLSEPRHRTLLIADSPLNYWLEQRHRWPHLAAMALDVYSTPVMSDEPERIFSEAGAAIGTRRRSLNPGTIRAAHCLKRWIRDGVITWNSSLFRTPSEAAVIDYFTVD